MRFESAKTSKEQQPPSPLITTNVGGAGAELEKRAREAGTTFSYGSLYAALAKGLLVKHTTRTKAEREKLASAFKKIESITDATEALAATNALFAEHAQKEATIREHNAALTAAFKAEEYKRQGIGSSQESTKALKALNKVKEDHALLGYEMKLTAGEGAPGVLDLGDITPLASDLGNLGQRTYIQAAATALINALPLLEEEKTVILTEMGQIFKMKVPADTLKAANDTLAPYHLSISATGVETEMSSTDKHWQNTKIGAKTR